MYFGYMGVRYNETPLSVRELVSFTDSKKTEFFEKMQRIGVKQCIVLSTCNRSEIFFFYPAGRSLTLGEGRGSQPALLHHEDILWDQVYACYAACFPEVDIEEYLQHDQGDEALVYLFRVAAGLESIVLGEDQILGQVVEALEFSQLMGMAGKELNKVVRDVIRCAKRIKEELRISEQPLSISYVGVRRLAEVMEEGRTLFGRRVLVIGSGRTAELALLYLREYGLEKIYVCNRTMRRARELHKQFPELTVVPYEERYQILQKCDVIVSATASPHLVVTCGEYQRQVPVSDGRIRYFLDLAAPRDIDRRLGDLPDVRIIDMDSLQEITEKNQKERARLAEESESLIWEAMAEIKEWFHMSRMDGTIESLQKRCHDIVADSYAYLNRKLELTGREQKLVKKVLNASLQRLLRDPIQELKHLDTEEEQEEYKAMIQRLFTAERD